MKEEQKYNKDLGFQVPQDFFENFEEQMMTQLNLEEKIGKEIGFQVPDGYFESLEKQLLPVKETKVVAMPQGFKVTTILYPLLAVAAVLAVILSLNTNTTESLDVESLEMADLEYYLIDETSLYDETTVEILFADNDILDNLELTEGIGTDGLYYYLEDEIEFNEIITE